MKKSVKIRVDGGSGIGLGHVMRCLSLGQMLKDEFDVSFFLLTTSSDASQFIEHMGFDYRLIDNEKDFLDTLITEDTVVLDGYDFDLQYQLRIKEKGARLVCIDDFASQYFVADIVINHAPGLIGKAYSCKPNTSLLLGPKYALLRPEFLNATKGSSVLSESINNVVICFGGADPQNLTLSTLEALTEFPVECTVIIGKSYTYRQELKAFAEGRSLKIKRDLSAPEMVEEFQKADVLIVPASGVLFEAVALQVPVVSGFYTGNQKNVYKGFLEYDAFQDAEGFDKESIVKAFNGLSLQRRVELVDNQSSCIDGNVRDRLISAFNDLQQEKQLRFRLATSLDSKQIYDWNTEAEARANSFSQASFTFEKHQKWFLEKLADDNTRFLVFFMPQVGEVGLVRLDNLGEEVLIGINLDVGFRGKGLAKTMLEQASEYAKFLFEKPIVAQIKETNMASIRVFEKAGYVWRQNLEINKSKSVEYVYSDR